jgi:hypothetical protein
MPAFYRVYFDQKKPFSQIWYSFLQALIPFKIAGIVFGLLFLLANLERLYATYPVQKFC